MQPPDKSNWSDDDPIVAEVRAERDAIAARFNYDLGALVAWLKQLEETERAKGRIFLSPPETDAAA